MYVLLGENGIKDEVERALEKRDIEYEDVDITGTMNFIRNSSRSITGVILFSSSADHIDDIIESVDDHDQNIKTIFVGDNDLGDNEKQKIDIVIEKTDMLVNTLLKEIELIESEKDSLDLLGILSEVKEEVAIFIHNNPDPDAIASAMAFEEICSDINIRSTTYYGGVIGHPENEVFIENTGFLMENISENEVRDIVHDSDKVVFLDFAEASVNNIVPEDITPDVIIDHHFTNKDIEKGEYTEIRSDIGATSTLMTRHLQNLDVKIEPLLAAALLYGIKVDTNDYTKNIYTSDYKVITFLSALADKELLDIFESPPMKSETLSALGRAINSRDFDAGVLTAYAGFIAYKDDIPQIAELLMRERDVMSLLVFGIKDDKIHMSARSKDLDINIGKKMKDAFSDIGSAGGHRHSAGGVIPLDVFENKDEAKIEITRRFKGEVIQG